MKRDKLFWEAFWAWFRVPMIFWIGLLVALGIIYLLYGHREVSLLFLVAWLVVSAMLSAMTTWGHIAKEVDGIWSEEVRIQKLRTLTEGGRDSFGTIWALSTLPLRRLRTLLASFWQRIMALCTLSWQRIATTPPILLLVFIWNGTLPDEDEDR